MTKLSAPILTLIASMLFSVSVGAQSDAAQEDSAIFSEEIAVELVEVEVFVRDKAGRPVMDLGPEDFEVFEDGRPVRITNFQALSPPETRVEPEIRPEETPSVPEKPIPPTVEPREPLSLILYVDNANIARNNRRRVMRNLREFVRSETEAVDRFLVASFDGSLKIRQPFTDSRQEVLQSLLKIEDTVPFGDSAEDEFRDLLREVEDRYARENWLQNRVTGFAQKIENEQGRSMRALRDIVDGVSGLEGRKAMVYVSDGLSLNPGEDLFNAMHIRFGNLRYLQYTREFDASREFQRLAGNANTAGVTFYTIHAAGLTAPLSSDVEVAGSGYDELRTTVDSVRTANLQGSGRMLAAETGGIAMLNTNDFSKGLGQMLDDFQSLYILAYLPPETKNDRYHDIKVKVKRKGVKIRHRTGYRTRNTSKRMNDAVIAAIHHGFAKNPMAVSVALGDLGSVDSSDSSRSRVVPVRVGIPIKELVLIPRGQEHAGNIRLFVSVQDHKGQLSPMQEISVPIKIPDEAMERALKDRWYQEIKMRMRPGRHLVAVGVWDDLGKESSIATQRLDIASR